MLKFQSNYTTMLQNFEDFILIMIVQIFFAKFKFFQTVLHIRIIALANKKLYLSPYSIYQYSSTWRSVRTK